MKDNIELYYRNWNRNYTTLNAEIDSDYGCVINLIVETAGYKGHGPIYLIKKDIPLYINKINDMYQKLEGSCRIMDNESDNSFIEFAFIEKRLIVSGLISDSQNILQFEFDADQTVLNTMLLILKKL